MKEQLLLKLAFSFQLLRATNAMRLHSAITLLPWDSLGFRLRVEGGRLFEGVLVFIVVLAQS